MRGLKAPGYALRIVSGEVTSAKENALSEANSAPASETRWVLVLVMGILQVLRGDFEFPLGECETRHRCETQIRAGPARS